MPRSPESTAREARRARGLSKRQGRTRDDGCVTGHPAVFAATPAFELGRIPEGGGYPGGFAELAARLMGCPSPALALHLCSGSVQAPLTVDLRRGLGARVIADVRWLPFRPASVRWIMADPPYSAEHAEELWGVGKRYPTPAVLLRDFVVPALPPQLERVGVWGVTTGVGYRIRALTIARRRQGEATLFEPCGTG